MGEVSPDRLYAAGKVIHPLADHVPIDHGTLPYTVGSKISLLSQDHEFTVTRLCLNKKSHIAPLTIPPSYWVKMTRGS